MKELFLLKLGEIVLKGQNRRVFEDKLKTVTRRRMTKFGEFKISIVQSTLYVEPLTDDCDLDGAWEACGTIFGVAQMCRCRACEKDLDAIFAAVCDYLGDELSMARSFKLVDVFTAAENIVLGLPGEKGKMDKAAVGKAVREIADRYGFDIDPNQKIYEMSVSQKQTVEIVKVLYRGADILILDEPTAVLTPQETEKLFTVMRNMKKDGKAIIIITHKLHEVLAVSDRVAVLRKGEYIGDTDTATASQQSLTDMMVGRAVSLNIDRPLNENQTERLKVEHLTVKNKEGVKMLDDVTFSAMGGEILGIAGIAGSGQKELLEAISGLQKLEEGSKITYIEPDGSECLLNGMDPLDIIRKGLLLSFVPEDRFGMGLVGGMNIIQNIMLRTYRRGKGPITDRKFPRDLSQKIVDDLEVVTPDIGRTPIRRLSGGNVQKVLVGREIAQNPAVLMTAYAVRGLDINTSYVIYNLLTEQKMKGVAVIYVGEDLDVLLELCDRILVLCGGKVSGIVDGRKTTKDAVGLMMTKIGG